MDAFLQLAHHLYLFAAFSLLTFQGLDGLIAKFEVASTLLESRGKYEKFQKSMACNRF
jgi:hypothetical protein